VLSDGYKLVDSLESLGVPGLLGCRTLKVSGSVCFAAGVVIEGDVSFQHDGPGTATIPAGTYRDQAVVI
jgi:hypothetical protein